MIAATRGAIAGAAVAELGCEADPPDEDVVEGQGELLLDRPGDLRLEVREARRRAAG